MATPKRFNIRVYGIWLQNERVLVSEEVIKGTTFVKFPGGGLELGEGIQDCLRREWQEELGMDIRVLGHFYTTDFYQPSLFDDTQVISIYYKIQPIHPDNYIINRNEHEHSYWVKLTDITKDTFSLPIDKRVAQMLLGQ